MRDVRDANPASGRRPIAVETRVGGGLDGPDLGLPLVGGLARIDHTARGEVPMPLQVLLEPRKTSPVSG